MDYPKTKKTGSNAPLVEESFEEKKENAKKEKHDCENVVFSHLGQLGELVKKDGLCIHNRVMRQGRESGYDLIAQRAATKIQRIRKLKELLVEQKGTDHRSSIVLPSTWASKANRAYITETQRIMKAVIAIKARMKGCSEEYQAVERYLKNTSLQDKNMAYLYRGFQEEGSLQMSKSKFIVICKALGLKYRPYRAGFDNSTAVKEQRKAFVESLLEKGILGRTNLFFFDVCSVSETSFKKRIWRYAEWQNHPLRRYQYNLLHLLVAVCPDGRYFVQFLRGNVYSSIVATFLAHVISLQSPTNDRPVILLDNARCHKTALIKAFAIRTETSMVFFPPYCPFFQYGGARFSPY